MTPNRVASLRLAFRALDQAAALPRRLAALRQDLESLARLVSAWARREYCAVPWRTIAAAVGALLYFLTPLDSVPDMIPGAGLADDAAVLAMVAAAVKAEIDRFVAWEARQAGRQGGEARVS